MEPGEDIVEASKREVLEETGMNFDPTTLILVEVAGGNWYRSGLQQDMIQIIGQRMFQHVFHPV